MADCKYSGFKDNVVKAIMYASVLSILAGSIKEEYGTNPVKHVELFRALSLLVFCSGYFGDEWIHDQSREGNDTHKDKPNIISQVLFPLDFLGWLFFMLQACSVSNDICFPIFGTIAIGCVSMNLLKDEARELYGCQVDDWLCENAIWLTWLLLSSVLPGNPICKSLLLFVAALLIFSIKFRQWHRHGENCTRYQKD